ncbi:nuclear transport factor 2 family protein [Nesterenkonia haasae]|uniref:nuclear transport factor 2 family protein n=1 Tax=Nesterenkonia haasae TaxID=2587813 RepID=UPI0013917C6B|nr:nuclear transport factor 2 family protein [Nesterenkonia haasae]NDK31940.1 nuclear transport factor 2 family protein [Nesterenkonia haasae]
MSELAPADRSALQELNARFAWALDDHEFDALREILMPEAHYVSVGREFQDLETIIASFKARTESRTTRHGMGNLLLSADGPGRATGRSSWFTFASNAAAPTDPEVYMVADFRDVYVLTPAGWRIAERIITPVFRRADLAPN